MCDESLSYLDNFKKSLRMLIIYEFQKCSTSYIRVLFADEISLITRIYLSSAWAVESGFASNIVF